MAKILAPNRAYSGIGAAGVVFQDGVAVTENEAAIAYFRQAGYEVDGSTDNPVTLPKVPDPRDYTEEAIGTRLRDAAVDPAKGDFLAPINAGRANPHGPRVVSPEIHASGPAGLRPGEVFIEDPVKQDARESQFAEIRLKDRADAGDANAAIVPDVDERGALDLSDPGSAAQGEIPDDLADAASEHIAKLLADGAPDQHVQEARDSVFREARSKGLSEASATAYADSVLTAVQNLHAAGVSPDDIRDHGLNGALALASAEQTGDQAPEPEKPLSRAPKSEWIAYAVAKGAPVAEASGKSKKDLIKDYR